jgi:hypothetical protein
MAAIASESWAGPDEAASPAIEPLGRAVQVALAIYLLPVVAVVCAIGGAAIAADHAGRLVARVAGRGRRPAWPRPHTLTGPVSAGRPHRVRARSESRPGL